MALPSPPLALSPAYLAMLQARQAPQAPPPDSEVPAPAERIRPAAGAGSAGRGRLIDLVV
jgi:hypothetical protein